MAPNARTRKRSQVSRNTLVGGVWRCHSGVPKVPRSSAEQLTIPGRARSSPAPALLAGQPPPGFPAPGTDGQSWAPPAP